jgi:hypothetical protein
MSVPALSLLSRYPHLGEGPGKPRASSRGLHRESIMLVLEALRGPRCSCATVFGTLEDWVYWERSYERGWFQSSEFWKPFGFSPSSANVLSCHDRRTPISI